MLSKTPCIRYYVTLDNVKFISFCFYCFNWFNGSLFEGRLGAMVVETVCGLSNLLWWWFWNFSVLQLKSIIFLYLNEPLKRLWLKIFCFQCQFWKPKINTIFLKMIFLSEYWLRSTTFINRISSINHSQGNLFSKMVPNFWRIGIKQSYKVT